MATELTELEELKQRQEALEDVVRHLDHRLTNDEQHLNSLIQMGPPVTPDDDRDTDGERTSLQDTWLRGVDGMLRSIAMHQGFHANALKDVKGDLKILRAQQDGIFRMITTALTEEPSTALQEGVRRIERMITEFVDRSTP